MLPSIGKADELLDLPAQTGETTQEVEEERSGCERHRRQPENIGPDEPAVEDRRTEQRRRHRHASDPESHEPQGARAPNGGASLQRTFGLHEQPAGAQHAIACRQAKADEAGEEHVDGAALKANDEETEHVALRQRGEQRTRAESPVPPRPVLVLRLEAEVEGDATDDKPKQHRRHRQV